MGQMSRFPRRSLYLSIPCRSGFEPCCREPLSDALLSECPAMSLVILGSWDSLLNMCCKRAMFLLIPVLIRVPSRAEPYAALFCGA